MLEECDPKTHDSITFLGAQFDKGLAWVHFPVGHGGLGLNPKLQQVVNERLFAAGAPNSDYRNPIGHGMCGPTVVAWGSEEQKAALPPSAVHRRGDLVPAVQRARRRIRLRRAGVEGRS